jgi:hypothetical protein
MFVLPAPWVGLKGCSPPALLRVGDEILCHVSGVSQRDDTTPATQSPGVCSSFVHAAPRRRARPQRRSKPGAHIGSAMRSCATFLASRNATIRHRLPGVQEFVLVLSTLPRDGALVLSDVRSPALTVVCEPCSQRGTYGVARHHTSRIVVETQNQAWWCASSSVPNTLGTYAPDSINITGAPLLMDRLRRVCPWY